MLKPWYSHNKHSVNVSQKPNTLCCHVCHLLRASLNPICIFLSLFVCYLPSYFLLCVFTLLFLQHFLCLCPPTLVSVLSFNLPQNSLSLTDWTWPPSRFNLMTSACIFIHLLWVWCSWLLSCSFIYFFTKWIRGGKRRGTPQGQWWPELREKWMNLNTLKVRLAGLNNRILGLE